MSARITAALPLLNLECILKALQNMGENYTVRGNDIVLKSRRLYYEASLKKQNNGRYIITGDQEKVGKDFQDKLVKEYKDAYEAKLKAIRAELARQELLRQKAEEEERRRLEQERIRLEQERKRIEEEKRKYVESQKAAIQERAKKLGYSVKETSEEGNIKLVLIKRTY